MRRTLSRDAAPSICTLSQITITSVGCVSCVGLYRWIVIPPPRAPQQGTPRTSLCRFFGRIRGSCSKRSRRRPCRAGWVPGARWPRSRACLGSARQILHQAGGHRGAHGSASTASRRKQAIGTASGGELPRAGLPPIRRADLPSAQSHATIFASCELRGFLISPQRLAGCLPARAGDPPTGRSRAHPPQDSLASPRGSSLPCRWAGRAPGLPHRCADGALPEPARGLLAVGGPVELPVPRPHHLPLPGDRRGAGQPAGRDDAVPRQRKQEGHLALHQRHGRRGRAHACPARHDAPRQVGRVHRRLRGLYGHDGVPFGHGAEGQGDET